MSFDYDYVIVGSGFGGSVSALRLAEKGYSVCVLEKGKRFKDSDFPKSNWNLRRFLWMPFFKFFGIQKLTLFRHILILSGTGVGGGSLVYANTLLQPGDEFFHASTWENLADWKTELLPHYDTAKKMLGVTENPKLTFVDQLLKDCARDLGREHTFKPSQVGVFFGEAGKAEPGKTVKDPYFGGKGPDRAGCIYCGGCMVGCRHNAKNTLVKNYLYFAEKLGVRVCAEREVRDIRPASGQKGLSEGYEIDTVCSTAWFKKDPKTLRAQKVILAGGVLGTVKLLFRCKYETRSLSKLSERLGKDVRTNSEALVGVSEVDRPLKGDYSEGIAISSIFHPDEHTHIEPVRYPKGSSFMKLLATPMVDGGTHVPRFLKWFGVILNHPVRVLKLIFNKNWAESTVILLVMQTLDNRMTFSYGRSLFSFFKKGMISGAEKGELKLPTYFPIANQVARAFAKKVNGIPQSAKNEVMLGIPTTAHILGGCGIGKNIENGVIDINHQVFGYPGLYVCDGSALPANPGVNPSLTITAMTERAISKIPSKTV